MAFIKGTPPDVRLDLQAYGHYREHVLLKKRRVGEWHRFFPSDPGGSTYALTVYRQGLDDYILLTAEETGVRCQCCGVVTAIGTCHRCKSPVFVLASAAPQAIMERGPRVVCYQCRTPTAQAFTCSCGEVNEVGVTSLMSKLEIKSGCFVATAVYGSELADEVAVIRNFRDETLIRSRPGRAFISLYYFYSPGIANALSRFPGLRTLVRVMVLNPFVRWLLRNKRDSNDPN